MYKKKLNYIFLLNLLLFLLCFYFTYNYNQFYCFKNHDTFQPYQYGYNDLFNIPLTRIPALILSKLFLYTLPNLFNMHAADFIVNVFVCTIICLLYLFIVIMFSQSLFIGQKSYIKLKNYFKKKETVILFPIAFILMSFSAFPDRNFLGISDEIAMYFEYGFGYIVYFTFFVILFDSILNNKNYKTKELIVISGIGFLLGIWCEYLNTITFFSLSLIILTLYFFSKEKFKTKSIILMSFSFYLGFILFYFIFGKFDINNMGSITNYNILDGMLENIKNINDFCKSLIYSIFVHNKFLWIIIISLSVILKINSSYFNKNSSENKIRVNLTIMLICCFIYGYLLTCCSSILIAKQIRGLYIFDHVYSHTIGFHSLLFCAFILLGTLYNNVNKHFKNIILLILLFSTIFLTYKFIPIYKEDIKIYNDYKNNRYNLEKLMLVYSVFNEPAIIYKYSIAFNISLINIFDYSGIIDKNNPIIKYKYYPININTLYYANVIYKHKQKAFIIDDNEDYVNKEFQKRLFLFKSIKENKNLFNIIQFDNLLKYDEINITLENIDKLQKKYGENDILLKTKARLFYDAKEYNKSLLLYLQYFNKHPKDIDTNIQIAKIYEIQNHIDKAINIYDELLNNDKDNVFLLFKKANLYYKQGKYNIALDIYTNALNNDIYSKINDYTNIINLNIALIYKKMGQDYEIQKYLNQINNIDIKDKFYNNKNEIELSDFDINLVLHY